MLVNGAASGLDLFLFSAGVLISAIAIYYRGQNFGEYKTAVRDFVFHHGWNCLVYIAVAFISLL